MRKKKNYKNFSPFKFNGNDCRIDDTLCVFLISFLAISTRSWAIQFKKNKFYFAWNVSLNNNICVKCQPNVPKMGILKLWKHNRFVIDTSSTHWQTKSLFRFLCGEYLMFSCHCFRIRSLVFFRVCSKCSTNFDFVLM